MKVLDHDPARCSGDFFQRLAYDQRVKPEGVLVKSVHLPASALRLASVIMMICFMSLRCVAGCAGPAAALSYWCNTGDFYTGKHVRSASLPRNHGIAPATKNRRDTAS